MKQIFKPVLATAAILFFFLLSSCNNKSALKLENENLKSEAAAQNIANQMIAKNLITFDTLDFTVFSNQDWLRLHESHAADIKVNWPDGHFTKGIERHIADLKAMFVYAPNTRIKEHPIRFGSGNMTCVTGIMTGTFSAPMPVGAGNFIQPTGKTFSLPMCTVGIWDKGVMIEEYLFWDNQTYMNQIGLGK